MNKQDAALFYASKGWYVLPVLPDSKIPATQHGVHDASIDPAQIRKWWESNPNYNIGIAAGERSNIVVFDVDPRNGGEDSWANWVTANGDIDGATQLTAGGGQHYVAQYTDRMKSCKLMDGVDLLSNGRYFVAFPSEINGKTYQWEASSDPFDGVEPFKVPEPWVAAYEKGRGEVKAAVVEGSIIQGGRNNALTSLAGAMRRIGMSEAEILAALAITNEERCDPPLPSSELAQIVRSVGRYSPDYDLMANASLGTAAAHEIIDGLIDKSQGFHFSRATSLISQPAPIKWLIKNWIPADSMCMLFGEAGAGKTFVALDMACHMAMGMPWGSCKTTPGTIVYMAGEGNYGLRQRLASWCKAHGVQSLDNLIVSNQAIDIDDPNVVTQVLSAVRELVQGDVACVWIDTVNNHMMGDENSAQDARRMVNACNIIARALKGAVCLVHHSGKGDTLRARGSSVWKASVDASICVSKTETGDIEVGFTKMKDAPEPQAIIGAIEPVDLGWIDDEGNAVFGAIFRQRGVAEPVAKYTQRSQSQINELTNMWVETGGEVNEDGFPTISRQAMLQYLMSKYELSYATANQYMKPSAETGLIHDLRIEGILFTDKRNFVVANATVAAMMNLRQQ